MITYAPVEVPLILIAQVQRSGGTLLSQLFDGHPQILAFPSELHFIKKGWPSLVDSVPKTLARHDSTFKRFVGDGYQKFSIIDDGERHRFDYDFRLRDEIITSILRTNSEPSNRDVFNAFFAAFFSAWRSRRTTTENPRYVTAFAASANLHLAGSARTGFFADYPDGHVISLVRRPLSWFASARRHGPAYEAFSAAMGLWLESTRSGLLMRDMFPAQVTLLTFESLISHTEEVMRALCARLGLEFDAILCAPTFDRMPIKSDSNFRPAYGIDQSVLHRDDFVPETTADRRALKTAEDLYQTVQATEGLLSGSARQASADLKGRQTVEMTGRFAVMKPASNE